MRSILKKSIALTSCILMAGVSCSCAVTTPKSLITTMATNAAPGKADQDQIAASMSTTDTALALDFDWFIGKVYNITDSETPVDPQNADRISGDEPYLLNGGWKCYMCSQDKQELGEYERYLNAVIDTDGKDFKVTLNWWLLMESSLPNGQEYETGSVTGTGKWDTETATVHTVANMGNIDFTDFYISKDKTEEYAMGTVTWSSGEVDHIGLMRMTPEKQDQYYTAMENADIAIDNAELIVGRAKKKSGAPEAEVTWDDNHTITIHLFEIVKERGGGEHTATWDWYTIDVFTMKGEDFFGNPVDLSKE